MNSTDFGTHQPRGHRGPRDQRRECERLERSDSQRPQRHRGGHARNVILLIGDGMGDSEITIARNYTVGAGGPAGTSTSSRSPGR